LPSIASYTEQLFLARRQQHHQSPHLAGGVGGGFTTTSPHIAVQQRRLSSVMPRPNPPPTPGSSSDIRGKEGYQNASFINLPPAAFPGVDVPDRASTSSSASSNNGSDSSYRPVSPGFVPMNDSSARRKSQPKASLAPAGPVVTKDDFTLPPPPTRSRKIIQMKPGEIEVDDSRLDEQAADAPTTGKAKGKRKSNAGSTAAGRKIARKTAHSLIERRRRSKMNEEFGVLKDMIPACKGQEMHKLAILQVCQVVIPPATQGDMILFTDRRTAGKYRLPSLPRTMCPRPSSPAQLATSATTSHSHSSRRRPGL
jgi:hypothetical protein